MTPSCKWPIAITLVEHRNMKKGNFSKKVTYEKFGTRDMVSKKDEAKNKTSKPWPNYLPYCKSVVRIIPECRGVIYF